jgi:hypothetical protein
MRLRTSCEDALKLTRPRPTEWRRRLDDCPRGEFIAGAEEEWRKGTGRPMTAEELERALRRYPGDATS